jgi:two-component system chemotaxis sensor kinase CheA
MVDAIRQMLKEIESTGADGAIDYPELRESLTQLQKPSASGAPQAAAASKSSQPSKKSKRPVSEAAATTATVEAPAKIATIIDDAPPPPIPDTRPRDAAPETIRVGVNLLDKLMTQVGELVLARNQLLQPFSPEYSS